MPGQMPIGGGVDGPQYSDYGDITDEQQMHAASHYARTDVNIMKDTLTLDLAQYSGDPTTQRWNPESPVLPPFTQLRTSGALQTTNEDLQQIEQEFMQLLEELPVTIRLALLKDMQLPEEERAPDLIGLEKGLLTQAELNVWAANVAPQFVPDKDQETDDSKGIFATEGSLSTETVGETQQTAATQAEQDAALIERVSEYVAQQVSNLESEVGALEGNFGDKMSLSAFLSQIGQVLLDAKEFLHLLSEAEFDLAKKLGMNAAEAANLLSNRLNDLSAMRQQAGQAQQTGGQGQQPNNNQQAPPNQGTNQTASPPQSGVGGGVGGTPSPVSAVQSQINRITSSIMNLSFSLSMALAGLNRSTTEISTKLLQKLMDHTQLTDRAFRALRESLVAGLEQLNLKEDEINELSLMELVSSIMALQFVNSEEILRVSGFQPSSKLGISEDPADQLDAQDQAEGSVSTSDDTRQLQRDTKSVSVQMAMGSTQAANMVERGAYKALEGSDHSEEEMELIASVMRLVSMLTSIMMGGRMLNAADDKSGELLDKITRSTLNEAALELQEIVDEMDENSPVAQFVNDLRLHELPLEEGGTEELLASRRDVLEEHGIDLDLLMEGMDSLANIAMEFTQSGVSAQASRRQVKPDVNVMI